MEDKIKAYVESIVPKNIPKKRYKEIYDEYISHIYDEMDFYTEIGYDKETAVEMVLKQMGQEKETKSSIINGFENLYKERTFVAVLIGVIPFLINLFMVCFGIWITSADYKGKPDYVSVVLSLWSIFIIAYLMAACYMKGMRKSLLAIGISLLLVFLIPLCCMFSQCGLYGILTVGSYLLDSYTGLVTRDVDFTIYISFISCFNTSFFLNSFSSFNGCEKKRCADRKISKENSGCVYFGFISRIFVCFTL